MAENSKKFDPYPKFEDKQKQWFVDLVDRMVTKPDEANVLHHRRGNDLELEICVAPEDRSIFTEEVCLSLQVLLASITGVFAPVVYLQGAPHPQADRAIQAAMNGL